LIWLRMTGPESCKHGNETLGCVKCGEFFSLAEELLPSKGFWSMDLVLTS